jgi:transposase
MRPGQPERIEDQYRRHGTLAILAGLEVHTGRVLLHVRPRRRGREFLEFLRCARRRWPCGRLVIILDNLSIHGTPEVRAWLSLQAGQVHFEFLPLHASWLNQIEIWFSILERQALTRTSDATYADHARRIYRFGRHWNCGSGSWGPASENGRLRQGAGGHLRDARHRERASVGYALADEYAAVSAKIDALYGQPPALPADYETTGMAKLRREAHARMLGNGLCTRPAELDCRMESACETCAYFRTSTEFLPVLVRQRDHAIGHGQADRAALFDGLITRAERQAP